MGRSSGWLLAAVLTSAHVVAAGAQTIGFSGPPVLGDRKVSWSWEPLAGRDPYFQGNTVLVAEGALPTPVPGTLRMLGSDGDNSVLFGVGSMDDTVYRWDPPTGDLITVLPPAPSPLRTIEIHRSGLLVIGGLEDGRVAVWDLREGSPIGPALFSAQRTPTTHVRFLLASNDPAEQRFVTAGAGDTLRIWNEPGSLLRRIVTGGVRALATNPAGSLLAVGDAAGVIRVYEPIRGTILQRLEGHTAAVRQLVFSSDQRKLLSLDENGKLILWRTSGWSKAFELQIGQTAGPIVGMRQPDGALVYTLDGEGFFQILDGEDGRVYRSADLTDGPAYAGLFAQLGRRVYVGRQDGLLELYRTGFCQPSDADPVCFGGYIIWRNERPDTIGVARLRTFMFGDSTWGFRGPERVFVDPDSVISRGADPDVPIAGPHNGQPYYYSLVPYERRYLNGSIFEVYLNSITEGFYRRDPEGPPTPVRSHEPAHTENPLLGNVIVVPNPYEAGKVSWDRETGAHVEFRNLPEQASIRIYSVAGDLLRLIEHGSGEFGEGTDTRAWDLKNARGEPVTSGVYIYHVSTRLGAEETKGYFIVIR